MEKYYQIRTAEGAFDVYYIKKDRSRKGLHVSQVDIIAGTTAGGDPVTIIKYFPIEDCAKLFKKFSEFKERVQKAKDDSWREFVVEDHLTY